MKLDTVLERSDSSSLLGEIVALRTHTSMRAKGVSQCRGSHYQFVAELDAKAEEWHMVTDQGQRWSAVDGMLSVEPEPPHEVDFPSGMPTEVQMLHPEAFLMWGRGGGESFYPMLIQEIGRRSLLITFEHVEDPALRATAVINGTTGIIEKMAMLGDVTILTEVEFGVQLDSGRQPEFLPITTDWIQPNY
ncbi:hypothetical protein ACFVTE_20610 [Arthrobacter sp. NPDC058097]|uniref:hypothetical protein n=1 Tax=Arthrobacter sp. NPDC058097 TaxID=3346340 RepID=UPI0036DEA2D2